MNINLQNAYNTLKAYCMTVRSDSSRQVRSPEDGELLGYWQTTEWVDGLLKLCVLNDETNREGGT